MKPLRIVFPLENIHSLAGATRVLYNIADIAKTLGHEVEVLGDREATLPGPDESVKVIRHYELEHFTEYYPLRTLSPSDLDESMRLLSPRAWEHYSGADLVWSFSGIYDRVEEHCEHASGDLRNHWSYQHWPVAGDYPHPNCILYANSTFTQAAVKARYGRDSRLLHPPIPLERYDPSPSYGDRDIDVIYIGRVDPLKLGRPPILQRFENMKTLIVGASNEASFPDYKPDITWIRNATMKQLTESLSSSKVYVHWKGLLDRSGYEHMGIVILEAMASGIPVVVPKGGGPWWDISERGKYCIGISSVDEGIREATRLCADRTYWEEWSRRAVEGVKRFSYENASEKLEKWLGEIS